MNEYDLLGALGGVDETYIEAAEKENRPARRPRWGVLAACLAALLLVGGGFGIAADAVEYRTALTFFEENSLSVSGLSRADIKKVYRDITTGSFALEKTAEVLTRTVPGFELPAPEAFTPEELEAIWNRNVWTQRLPGAGIAFRTDYTETMNEALGFETLEKSAVTCYKNGDVLWTADFPGVFVENCADTALGAAVWGTEKTELGSRGPATVARVDETGAVLWSRRLSHGFQSETVAAVLDTADGNWAVISKGDKETLCFAVYDGNGNLIFTKKSEIGGVFIRNAVRLGDGYLVQLFNTLDRERDRIVKLDAAGSLTDSFTYTADDCDYYITDMTEFGGRVYLSAYATPKQTDEGGRDEIADILDDIFAREPLDISEEELTPMVQQNYTAVLLLCDPEGGAPQTFYSVPGALGGGMRVNDAGDLEWEAQRLESAFFSPATNAFTIGGVCRIVRYTFDASGALIKQDVTQETVGYYR